MLAALALGASAQTPATVRLAVTYTPDSWLLYSASIHTDVVTHIGQGSDLHATLTTEAEAQLHVQPGATTNNFSVEARFIRYTTTLTADNAQQKAELEKQAAATDQAAVSMAPARFRVAEGHFNIVFRQPGAAYDQAVDMLSELARTDDLPSGAVAVGAAWSRTRSRAIPETTIAMPLTLHCTLTGLGREDGLATATIAVHASSGVNLPPGSLPGSQQMASEGLVPLGKFSFNTQAQATYRVADGILLETHSETHSNMNIQFIGPSPQALTSESEIHSIGTVKLEKILKVPGHSPFIRP
ncbi:MAG: hypothetical protein ACRD1C_08500 [Terriglobales bacterium]